MGLCGCTDLPTGSGGESRHPHRRWSRGHNKRTRLQPWPAGRVCTSAAGSEGRGHCPGAGDGYMSEVPAHMEILAEDTWTLVEAHATEKNLHPDIRRQGTLILRMLARERQLLTAEQTMRLSRKARPTLDLSLLGPASIRRPGSQVRSPMSVGAAPNLPSIFAQSPMQSPQFARSIRPVSAGIWLPSISKARSEPALSKPPWGRIA